MGIPDGAHTHGSGGSGLGMAVLVLVAAALAVKLAAPVAAALGELLRVVLIAASVLLSLAGTGLVALVAVRVRRKATSAAGAVRPPSPRVRRPARALPEPRPAIDRPQEVHLHLHGVTAEDIAAILRHRDE